MAEERDFESMFREKFEGFEEIPSEKIWKGVHRNLSVNDFFHFSFKTMNIYYVTAFVAALVGGILVFSGEEKDALRQNDILITDSIPREIVLPDSTEKTLSQPSINDERVKDALKEVSKTAKQVVREMPAKVNEIKEVEIEVFPENEVVETESELESIIQPHRTKAVASFKMSSNAACGPTLVEFTNTSENAVNYTWDFGDGVISNQRNPVYLYERPGVYFVELRANDVFGNISLAIDTITIKAKPKAQFEYLLESNGHSKGLVYFYNYSGNADSYLWDFGDGNTSTHMNPTHIYRERDDYRVSLIVTNTEGCSDTMIVDRIFPESDYFIRFPSAFSPNPSSPGDGRYSVSDISNQVFFPVWKGVAEYQLQIYNRTGMLMFESNDLFVGWNGYYRNQLVKPDVYIWKVTGKYLNGNPFVFTGDVTVILRR
jgi:PKD repeat protein